MQRLHLFDDTIRERIDEHDVDDPENMINLIYSDVTHYLLTAEEFENLLPGFKWGRE